MELNSMIPMCLGFSKVKFSTFTTSNISFFCVHSSRCREDESLGRSAAWGVLAPPASVRRGASSFSFVWIAQRVAAAMRQMPRLTDATPMEGQQ